MAPDPTCDSTEPIRGDLGRDGTMVVNTREMAELLGRRRNRILVWSAPGTITEGYLDVSAVTMAPEEDQT